MSQHYGKSNIFPSHRYMLSTCLNVDQGVCQEYILYQWDFRECDALGDEAMSGQDFRTFYWFYSQSQFLVIKHARFLQTAPKSMWWDPCRMRRESTSNFCSYQRCSAFRNLSSPFTVNRIRNKPYPELQQHFMKCWEQCQQADHSETQFTIFHRNWGIYVCSEFHFHKTESPLTWSLARKCS